MAKLQRNLLISITGALRSTSTESLNTILNLLPIDLFAKGVAYKTAVRLKESNWFKQKPFGHSNIDNIDNISTDYNVPNNIFDKHFETKFPKHNINFSYNLPSECSIFQAEIAAILKGAEFLKDNTVGQLINFYIDSQAAIKALGKITYTLN